MINKTTMIVVIGTEILNKVIKDNKEKDKILTLIKQMNIEGISEKSFESKKKELLKILKSKEVAKENIEKKEITNIRVSKKVIEKKIESQKIEKKELSKVSERSFHKAIFEKVKDGVALKGFSMPVPDLLINKLQEAYLKIQELEAYPKEEIHEAKAAYNALLNFWYLCMLNPNANARRDAFKYITLQKFIITQNGYFVTFRRIVSTTNHKVSEKDIKVETFVSQQYFKIKLGKKSPKNYLVIDNKGEFKIVDIKGKEYELKEAEIKLGILDDLYKLNSTKKEKVIYTDHRTKKMVIKIGEVVNIPREQCNEDATVECSDGLHVGSLSYMRENSDLGDTLVAVLVNPAHIVSVPYADAHKMRVCEYFPFAIVNDELLKDVENSAITLFDNSYKTFEESQLKEMLSNVDMKNYLLEEKEVKDKTDYSEEYERVQKLLSSKKVTLSSDKINEELSPEELKQIVLSRTVIKK